MVKLTSRQNEIARLAAAGLSNKLIANQLGISVGTVKIHMHALMARLGFPSRTVLAAQWRQENLTRPLTATDQNVAVNLVAET